MSRITALAYFVVYCLALPAILLRLLISPGRVQAGERFAIELPPQLEAGIWLHASSVGEVALLEPIVAALEREAPQTRLVITAFTATGVATASERFGRHHVCPLPFDFRFAVRRYVRRVNPQLCVIVESEFWPGMLSVLHDLHVPVAVLNAKMSERSLRTHLRTKFVAQAIRTVAIVAAQDAQNAERFRRIGVPGERVQVTGNMKYDLISPDEQHAVRSAIGIAEDAKVIVGGSLHDGEADELLDAIYVPGSVAPSVVTLLAPRYTHEADSILASADRRGLRAVLKTKYDSEREARSGFDVCVIDTFGELRSLYAVADVVFVGGSLFDRGSGKGGHNLMEPAICSVPVLFGPFNYSFAQVARELEDAGGGKTVRNAAELRDALQSVCGDAQAAARMGKAARAVVMAGQGGTARNIDLIRGLLEQRTH